MRWWFLAIVAALVPGGCSFGPKVLERTHGRYNEAVRCVEQEEFLRNVVRMRYNESPLSLGVTSIAAQYELSASAEARPFFSTEATGDLFRSFSRVLPFAAVGGADRPTVTLDPGDDGTAVRQFLTPIKADTFIFLARTSWPVSTVLRLYAERLNGVPNAASASGPPREVAPDFARFQRIAELFQIAQDRELASVHGEERAVDVADPVPADAVTPAALVEAAKNGLEYRRAADGKSWVLVRKERRLILEVNPGAEATPEVLELAGLLNLRPGARRYELAIVGGGVRDPLKYPEEPSDVLRLVLRSTAQVYFYLANGVEAPAEHLNRGLVRPPRGEDGRVFDGREITHGLFEVHACKGHKPPANAYVAVCYRGYWYYVDDADQASKATLALMLQLTRLDFARQRLGAGPQLTLPVGR